MLPLANEPFSFILYAGSTSASSKPVFTVYVDPVQKGAELPIALDEPDEAKHDENGDLEARLTILRGVAQTPEGAYREAFSWDVLPASFCDEKSDDDAMAIKAALEEAAKTDPDEWNAYIAGCWRTAQFVASSTGRFPKVYPTPSPFSDN